MHRLFQNMINVPIGILLCILFCNNKCSKKRYWIIVKTIIQYLLSGLTFMNLHVYVICVAQVLPDFSLYVE